MSDENYEVEGGFRWYENEGLKEIIIKCLFSKPTSLGIAFPELFPHISPPCLAFFVVMVCVSVISFHFL